MTNIKWALDPIHSEVVFKIKHLMISTVTGQFKKFNVVAETGTDDFNTAKNIEFTADVESVDTNNEQRDGHLKSADFFNAEQYPQLKFTGKKYEVIDGEGTISGELTMHGITKPVTLKVEFGGVAKDPYGQTKAGFTVTGKISRKEFGLSWGAVTETGNVVLGDEVKINAEIQLVKQVEALVEEEQLA
ncbi:YceI family protein [Ginsengibacter hankyongi]|uniref:YceI family protein n=1 Tax=Ginsengibacter hankyongi TaxID=2607284 RepID=A0A5J5IM49_9BACT|nr:YceI family protein [Ginsengibacter hankyongi]KAA9040944.1 YceI family protein [Ginsengibacter hankyongi]